MFYEANAERDMIAYNGYKIIFCCIPKKPSKLNSFCYQQFVDVHREIYNWKMHVLKIAVFDWIATKLYVAIFKLHTHSFVKSFLCASNKRYVPTYYCNGSLLKWICFQLVHALL